MTLEKRVTNLENMLASVMKNINNNKFYTDADVDSVRKSVSDMTPFTITKTAYIDDTYLRFEDVPNGNISVSVSDPDILYSVIKDTNIITISFNNPLKEVIEVTLSIL